MRALRDARGALLFATGTSLTQRRSSDTDRRNQDWQAQTCSTECRKPFAATLDGTDQADRVKKRRLCIHLYLAEQFS
jgi:hypothetical protein